METHHIPNSAGITAVAHPGSRHLIIVGFRVLPGTQVAEPVYLSGHTPNPGETVDFGGPR